MSDVLVHGEEADEDEYNSPNDGEGYTWVVNVWV
jgi:hypothetical protein